MPGLFKRKPKNTDPVLEQITNELEASLSEGRTHEAEIKYRRLVKYFEDALQSGKLSEAQQSHYYDRIHEFREKLIL